MVDKVTIFTKEYELSKASSLDELPLEVFCAIASWQMEHCGAGLREMIENMDKKDFFYGAIPTRDIKGLVMENTIDLMGETFDEYHNWYCGGGGIPNHGESKWPCIVATDESDEFFIDGWHRFHSYIRKNHDEIPILAIRDH